MRSMDVTRLKDLLDKVRAGTSTIDEALAELRDLPFRDLKQISCQYVPD